MMRELPAALADCKDAEDYFRLLGVEYDRRVLDVGRLHILKLFAGELAALAQTAPTGDADSEPPWPVYRAALERAYQAVVDQGPLQHRVFKVLKDRAPRQFVPVDDLFEPEGESEARTAVPAAAAPVAAGVTENGECA